MSGHTSTENGDAESLEQMYRIISDMKRKMQVEKTRELSVIGYTIQKLTNNIKNYFLKPPLFPNITTKTGKSWSYGQ
jgi:hypothetical protein